MNADDAKAALTDAIGGYYEAPCLEMAAKG